MKSKQVPITLNTHQPIEPKKEEKHKIYEKLQKSKLENKARVGEKEKLTQEKVIVKAKGEKMSEVFGCVDRLEVMICRLVNDLTENFFFPPFFYNI